MVILFYYPRFAAPLARSLDISAPHTLKGLLAPGDGWRRP
jgi:hypothetical protein